MYRVDIKDTRYLSDGEGVAEAKEEVDEEDEGLLAINDQGEILLNRMMATS